MLCTRTFYRCTTLFRKCMWKHRWERSLSLSLSLSLSSTLFPPLLVPFSLSLSFAFYLSLSLSPSLSRLLFSLNGKENRKIYLFAVTFSNRFECSFHFCKKKLLIGGERNKNQLLLTLLICSESDFESHYPWRGNQVFEHVFVMPWLKVAKCLTMWSDFWQKSEL